MYEKVEDRSEHMRSIPEKEQRWAEKQFKVQGYIYYKKCSIIGIYNRW